MFDKGLTEKQELHVKDLIAILRSGKYTQIKGEYSAEDNQCCFLGLVSRVLHKTWPHVYWPHVNFSLDYFGDYMDTMPIGDGKLLASTVLNDHHGWTFKKFADVIEGELAKALRLAK